MLNFFSNGRQIQKDIYQIDTGDEEYYFICSAFDIYLCVTAEWTDASQVQGSLSTIYAAPNANPPILPNIAAIAVPFMGNKNVIELKFSDAFKPINMCRMNHGATVPLEKIDSVAVFDGIGGNPFVYCAQFDLYVN